MNKPPDVVLQIAEDGKTFAAFHLFRLDNGYIVSAAGKIFPHPLDRSKVNIYISDVETWEELDENSFQVLRTRIAQKAQKRQPIPMKFSMLSRRRNRRAFSN